MNASFYFNFKTIIDFYKNFVTLVILKFKKIYLNNGLLGCSETYF